MNKFSIVRFTAVVGLFTLGAGCTPAQPRPTPPNGETPTPTSTQTGDLYEGWSTVTPGGVVSLRIPPGCIGDPGAGNLYIACPEPGDDTPTPRMHISSDGIQVNIRRGEDTAWDQWDAVIQSVQIVTPLNRDIQVNIQR